MTNIENPKIVQVNALSPRSIIKPQIDRGKTGISCLDYTSDENEWSRNARKYNLTTEIN